MAGVANRYLYVLANGLNEIIGYRVASNSGLTQVTTVPVPTGVAGVGAHETSTGRVRTDQTCSRVPLLPAGTSCSALLDVATGTTRARGRRGSVHNRHEPQRGCGVAPRRGLPLGRAQPGRTLAAESAGRGT